MSERVYVALMGDIIQSKQSLNRNELQAKIIAAIEALNADFKDSIAANFVVFSGDSIQGLLVRPHDIFRIIYSIETTIYPAKIRIGIGIGSLSTTLNEDHSMHNDGQCYHFAKQSLEFIENQEKQHTSPRTNIRIQSTGTDELVNALLSLSYIIKSNWTERQREIIDQWLASGRNQRLTAETLGINQSTVNRSLKSANMYSIQDAEGHIIEHLSERVR